MSDKTKTNFFPPPASKEPSVGASIARGALCVALYSVAFACLMQALHTDPEAQPQDAQAADMERVARVNGFVTNLMWGPILWIIGSGLFACGLTMLGAPRPFRRVLATTGGAFFPLAAAVGLAWVLLALEVSVPEQMTPQAVALWLTRAGFAVGAWAVVTRARWRMGVEPVRSAIALAFAAVLFVLGMRLPGLLSHAL